MHRVTAILLAAGMSKRMGSPKQLLPLNGKPMIRHCLDAILESEIDRPVVVLGPGSEETRRAIQDLPLNVVFNNQKDSEMAQSVRIGIHAVDDACSAVFICLSDHPMVSIETFRILMEWHSQHPDQILIPTYKEKRGHPTLFPLPVLKEIFPDGNLRGIINRNSERVKEVPVIDEGVVLDLDTDEDYQKIREKVETSL